MDSELRDALTRAAAPVDIVPDERHRVRDAIAADRRRRTTMLTVGGAIAAVAAIAVGVAVVDGGVDDRPGVTDRGGSLPTGGWERIASSPLTARGGAVAAWTGEEVLVVGGSTALPCPPGTDCQPPPSQEFADAAAYNPATDTWRELAPSPVDVPSGFGVWVDDELVVVSGRSTLIYNPDSDEWRQLPDLPRAVPGGGLVVDRDQVVRFAYQQPRRPDALVDWRLDLTTEEWSALPHDPFAESYDRSMTWHDGRLWLLSMDVEHHFGANEGAPSRLAVLDGDTWTVVDDATPDLTYDQRLIAHGGVLVIPGSGWDAASPTRIFDPANGGWRIVDPPPLPAEPCPLGGFFAGNRWIAAGGTLISAAPMDTEPVPACPGIWQAVATVWADDRLLIWGGVRDDFDSHTADGWVWTPRPPE